MATNQTQHEVTIYAEPIMQIGNFHVTNSLLTSWLAVLVIVALCVILKLNLKKVPGKIQHIF